MKLLSNSWSMLQSSTEMIYCITGAAAAHTKKHSTLANTNARRNPLKVYPLVRWQPRNKMHLPYLYLELDLDCIVSTDAQGWFRLLTVESFGGHVKLGVCFLLFCLDFNQSGVVLHYGPVPKYRLIHSRTWWHISTYGSFMLFVHFVHISAL